MKFKKFIKQFKDKILGENKFKVKPRTNSGPNQESHFKGGRKENVSTIEYGRDISAI